MPVNALITGSPELHSIEQVHLCCFGSAHNVAHRHQRAGVQLARALLGGVQDDGEERSELVGKQESLAEGENQREGWLRFQVGEPICGVPVSGSRY